MLKSLISKKCVYFTFLFILSVIVIVSGVICGVRWYDEYRVSQYPFEVMKQESVLHYHESKGKLVTEVSDYIGKVSPTSTMNGYAIVDLCEKYDLDIKFVLAQAQIESKFGTTGMAVKTNSVFNVGAYDKLKYDDINGKYKYKHPDFSIEPYMQLLYRDYITGSKTELDLMAKYVNKDGKRYASNPDYEDKILKLYQHIDTCTNISTLQGEMRRYKIISGV